MNANKPAYLASEQNMPWPASSIKYGPVPPNEADCQERLRNAELMLSKAYARIRELRKCLESQLAQSHNAELDIERVLRANLMECE